MDSCVILFKLLLQIGMSYYVPVENPILFFPTIGNFVSNRDLFGFNNN